MSTPSAILWIDIETAGLHPQAEILEVAYQLTDPAGYWLDHHGRWIASHLTQVPKGDLKAIEMHIKNGLLEECIETPGPMMSTIRNFICEMILIPKRVREENAIDDGSVVIGGRSVHFDIERLAREEGGFYKKKIFSHRRMDISAIRQAYHIAQRKMKVVELVEFPQGDNHRAEDDVNDTIEEYMYYLDRFSV